MYIPIPEKKSAPPTEPKKIAIGAPVAPAMLISEESEPTSRGDDIVPPPTGMPVGESTEEEQLAIALKASTDTALEERVARRCQ